LIPPLSELKRSSRELWKRLDLSTEQAKPTAQQAYWAQAWLDRNSWLYSTGGQFHLFSYINILKNSKSSFTPLFYIPFNGHLPLAKENRCE
jgi:hypothetical protein